MSMFETFEDVGAFEDGEDLSVDLTPFTEYVQALIASGKKIGSVTVLSGESDGNGRGKAEKQDAKNFQLAANRLDRGLTVRYRHVADGKTVLRFKLGPKRVMPQATKNARVDRLAADEMFPEVPSSGLLPSVGGKEPKTYNPRLEKYRVEMAKKYNVTVDQWKKRPNEHELPAEWTATPAKAAANKQTAPQR